MHLNGRQTCFSSASSGWSVGDNSAILHTADGHLGAAAAWETVTLGVTAQQFGGTSFQLFALDCQHDPQIWVAGRKLMSNGAHEAFIFRAAPPPPSHRQRSPFSCGVHFVHIIPKGKERHAGK